MKKRSTVFGYLLILLVMLFAGLLSGCQNASSKVSQKEEKVTKQEIKDSEKWSRETEVKSDEKEVPQKESTEKEADTEPPYLMNAEGKVTSFDNQVILSANLEVTPSYDLTGYHWEDNTKVEESFDEITCTDPDKHVWTVILSAKDAAGNETRFSYTITVEQKTVEEIEQEAKQNSAPADQYTEAPVDSQNNEDQVAQYTSNEPVGTTQTSGYATVGVTYGSNPTYDQQVIDQVNALRSSLGLSTLVFDQGMYDVAVTRANHMIEYGYFDHYYEGVAQFTYVADNLGVRKSLMGENIAKSNNASCDGYYMYNLWYNSPSHYENMVYGDFRTIGVAIVPYETDIAYYYTDGSFAYYKKGTAYMGVQIFGN